MLQPRRYATGDLLRNGRTHFGDDVERVELHDWSHVKPLLGLLETRYVEYDGEAYRVSAEEFEDG